jgi:transposase
MASATSLDLRRRVVEAYRRGGVTYAEVAARFAVGQASVSRWLRRARQTGDVKPLPHGGGYPRRISKEQEPIVERLVQEHPDWSEEELAKAVREKLSIQVSAVTVGRVVRRLGYSVKKKRSSRPNVIEQTSSVEDANTTSESDASPLRVWFLWTKPVRTRR